MDNNDVAAVFKEIADLLAIQGGNPHRIRAFSRTARVVEGLPQPVATMIRYGTLSKTPGLGDGSVRRIKDILKTGTCDEHRKLRAALPPGLRDMLDVKGIGPRTIRILYQNLRIGSVDELEVAILSGAVRNLPRIGQKRAEKMLAGIHAWRDRLGRVPWADARRWVERLAESLRELAEVDQLMIGGSVRRGKATVGDLDILVGAYDAAAVTARFLTLPEVDEVLVSGTGRCSVKLHNRQQCDLRILEPPTFGAGMHYFTGSKLHNIAIRARGLKLFDRKISDKGIFDRHTEVLLAPGKTEEEIFAAVGLPWIPPEIRENTGEIEAAAAGRLPRLIEASDLVGDLHTHTTASDGKGTVLEMAEAAIRHGHQYLAITDHTQSLAIARGLDEQRVLAQIRHIRDVEQQLGRIHLLAGTECDVLSEGRLDLDAEVLRSLDWVVCSAHLGLDIPGDVLTDRYIKAMETGLVDCIGHPQTRRLGKRSGPSLDFERLFKAARRLGVAVEINGNPYRMDLSDVAARKARDLGVRICINTDAHAPGHLARQEYGVITARRGWIRRADVLNTHSIDEVRQHRADRLRTFGIAVKGLPARDPATPPVVSTPPAPLPASDHWPEPDDAQPETAEGHIAGKSAPLDLTPPLDDALRQRIQAYMEHGGDDELEAALSERSDNPLQAAFALLFG